LASSEVPHKEIKYFDEPVVLNVGAEYFIRLKFVESTELPSETNLVLDLCIDLSLPPEKCIFTDSI